MSGDQFYQTVALEEEWRAALEAREIERANEILAEMRAARDEEFREELESRFPILKGWSK